MEGEDKMSVHYDPYKLALVPREKVVRNFRINDNDYEVEVISRVDSRQKLSKKNVSKIIMLALAGALTLGATGATINIITSPSTSAEATNDDYTLYDIPAEITGLSDISVKVFPDGTAYIGEEEASSYNGKKAEELVLLAGSKGMLYRHFDGGKSK